MKTLTIPLLAIIFILHLQWTASAQEHKIPLTSGTLKFNEVNNLSIEGYNGNEVVITTLGRVGIPERAKGLRPINSQGMEDNTGIGLSVSQSGDVVEVQQIINQNNDGRYLVKVPANVKVQVSYVGVHGDDIKISNLQNEVEVSTRHNSISLENISGPALINSVHGNITASFSALKPDSPISIISVHNDVDVALPADAKADLTLASQHGTIYTDMNLEYAKSNGDMRKISSEIEGTLNGGGTEIVLKSNHNNVYLRKK